MDSKPLKNCDIVNSVRNMAISRRGGVRTRGGRLPPIRIPDVAQTTRTNKVITPNIPQRRIKKEVDTSSTKPQVKYEIEARDDALSTRGRGRGRQSKVIIQTDGGYLAEGPALKMKKDPVNYESCSVPRFSRKTDKVSCEAKYDPETLQYLLDSCETNQFDEDDFGEMEPYRLPLLNEKQVRKISKKIKSEPIDEEYGDETKIKREITEDEPPKAQSSPVLASSFEEFQNAQRDGMLILLQLPNPLPFAKEAGETSSKEGKKEKEDEKGKEIEPEKAPSIKDSVEEGRIGKLQFLKSGRMRMVLGSVAFELLDAIPSESYSEAVTLKVNESGADLTILGKIDRRMVLSPIIEELVETESTCVEK